MLRLGAQILFGMQDWIKCCHEADGGSHHGTTEGFHASMSLPRSARRDWSSMPDICGMRTSRMIQGHLVKAVTGEIIISTGERAG
jgi:hypothetical protein